MKKDKFRVLVVDDEDSIRNRCVQLLQKKGYDVQGVNDGEKALFFCKKDGFSLVIADIRMPGMNGIDLLEKIKETISRHGSGYDYRLWNYRQCRRSYEVRCLRFYYQAF